MDTLFDPACRDRFLHRIDALTPTSQRAWGKMDAAQMLAHCALALETATGDATLRRNFMAKILGPLFKGMMVGPKPFSRGSPTHPMLVMSAPKDFAREKARLVAAVRKFQSGGPSEAAKYEHGFVGKLTGDEWSRVMVKHLDHHLAQFGV